MRDIYAGKLRNHLNCIRRPTEAICGIDFLPSVLTHIDKRVAWNRDERNRTLRRIDTGEDHGVASIHAAIFRSFTPRNLVGSKQQHVERLVCHIGLDKRRAQVLIDTLMQAARDRVDIRKCGNRADKQDADDNCRHDCYVAAFPRFLGSQGFAFAGTPAS